jgi:hypothetical protein
MHRPHWWEWELEFTPHIEKRMVQRNFTEIDIRTMLENAIQIKQDHNQHGRWIIVSKLDKVMWEIIVEPDIEEQLIILITAFPIEE